MTNRRDEYSADRESPASADERDQGWGGREWADRKDAKGTDPDLERLLAERPPHHEERER
jgi:hypothetical protein